jgi:DNA-binding transcriptional regulator YhcF (GntR family)
VVQLVKPLILNVLTDDYLCTVQELANDSESDRETVQAALRELQQEGKVLTMRHRRARS